MICLRDTALLFTGISIGAIVVVGIISFVFGLLHHKINLWKYQYFDGGRLRKCRNCGHTERRSFLKDSW